MAWFKVDDTLHGHPKVRRAGAAAVGVWVTAGSFCGAYKTDGFVPQFFIDGWGKTGQSAARKLVEVGLWDVATRDGEPGFQFHDWADYQPSSDEIERDRERSRERQRLWRERSREKRNAIRSGHDDGDVTRDVTRDETRRSRCPVPSRPVPSSLPTVERREGTSADAEDAPTTRGRRLAEDWAPSPETLEWARSERPDLDLNVVIAQFHDHWLAQPGAKGRKTDWTRTFRNWVRNEKRQYHRDDRSPSQRDRDRQAAEWRRRSEQEHAQRETKQRAQIGA